MESRTTNIDWFIFGATAFLLLFIRGFLVSSEQWVSWAFALGAIPIALVYLDGLEAVQTAAVLASLPLLLVYLVLARSLIRMPGQAGGDQ